MLSQDEQTVAKRMGLSAEDYARSRYAIDLTDFELRDKAQKLVGFVDAWLGSRRILATVESVWLKTFEGKYKIDLLSEGRRTQVTLDESLIDEILERGSPNARRRLENLLEINLLPESMARAS